METIPIVIMLVFIAYLIGGIPAFITGLAFSYLIKQKNRYRVNFLTLCIGFFVSFIPIFLLTFNPNDSPFFSFVVSLVLGILGLGSTAVLLFFYPKWKDSCYIPIHFIDEQEMRLSKTRITLMFLGIGPLLGLASYFIGGSIIYLVLIIFGVDINW